MIKKILLGVGLLAASIANAGQNFSYSYLGAVVSFTHIEVLNKKLDGKGYTVGGSYELKSVPLNLLAGFSHNSVDKDEIGGAEISTSSYSVGVQYVLSVHHGLDLLPGLQATYIHQEQKAGVLKDTQGYNAFAPSMKAKYRLNKGLVLDAGIAHVMYSEDSIDNGSSFSIGAEYEVGRDWSFGISKNWMSDSGATEVYVKVFY